MPSYCKAEPKVDDTVLVRTQRLCVPPAPRDVTLRANCIPDAPVIVLVSAPSQSLVHRTW